MAINKLSIAKLLELLLSLVCLGLHYHSWFENDELLKVLIAGTFVSYTIISTGMLLGYLGSSPINIRLDVFFSLIGCGLFIASGVLIIEDWENAVFKDNKIGMAKGSISIINGAIFLIDVIFTCVN